MQVGFIDTMTYQVISAPPHMDTLEHYIAAQAKSFPTPTSTFAYKKAAKKVHPIATSLPEDFHIIRHCPKDPLLTLPPLPTHPPPFTPGTCLTQECLNDLNLNCFNFLWPKELKLAQHVLKLNEKALAWTEDECGQFHNDYFSPVKIPTIAHTPWVHKNIPIPTSILDNIIDLFKKKITAGVYEQSDASY